MENMSAKRRATSDLNHDNWDREFEPEKMGTFQTAPEDELKSRVIRKARRKLASPSASTLSDGADGQTKSVFSGFAGFGKTSSTLSAGSNFSVSSVSTSASFGNSDKKGNESKAANTFSFLTQYTAPATEDKPDTPSAQILSTNNNNYNFAKSNTYYAKLKGLNQSVSDWIKTHVEKNPLCLLTPIFKDYEKHLSDIEKNECLTKQSDDNNHSAAPVPSTQFSFGNNEKKTPDASTESKKSSIFGSTTLQKSEDKIQPSTGFSFGLKSGSPTTTPSAGLNASSSTGFSFSGGKPFSFGNIAPPPAADPSADKENADEEDEPPKVEFKAVVEEDSVYSQRCKVFIKNDGTFADRGVGTLYLKPVKSSEKVQLLVRADTNLGNILVNFILSDLIPTKRMGENNVMLVCNPTPETKKPTPMLLRVKTSEEADKLLETINKYKK